MNNKWLELRRTGFALSVVFLILLFLSLFGWFYMRQKVVNPSRGAYLPSFVQSLKTHELVAFGGQSGEWPPNTLEALKAAAGLDTALILWVDAQATRDNEIVLFSDPELSTSTEARGWVRYKTLVELEKLDAGHGTQLAGKGFHLLSLKAALEAFPNHRFIVNLLSYSNGVDQHLQRTIVNAHAESRVMIQSDQEGVLRDMRKLEPSWAFGASLAQSTQLLTLLSVGLEKMFALDADVYVSPFVLRRQKMLPRGLAEELQRRLLKIFVGPVDDVDKMPELAALGACGLITPNPRMFLSWISAAHHAETH